MKTSTILVIVSLISTTLAAETCTASNKCITCGSGKQCTAVSEGFLKNDKTRGNLSVSNCIVGEDANTCTKCQTGFGLVTDNSKRTSVKIGSCIEVNDKAKAVSGYSNCSSFKVTLDTSESGDTFICATCSNGMKNSVDSNTNKTVFCNAPTSVIASECILSSADKDNGLCLLCSSEYTCTTNVCRYKREGVLEGCLSSSTNLTCDGECDAEGGYFATGEGTCTKSSETENPSSSTISGSNNTAKIAGAFFTLSIVFASF